MSLITCPLTYVYSHPQHAASGHKKPIHTTGSISHGDPCLVNLFIYLFGVLRRFQHCTGHIMTGSWKGRGNQYIQFVRVLYCKLPTNSKQLPAFQLEAVPVYHKILPPPEILPSGGKFRRKSSTLASEVGGESVTTLPPCPPMFGEISLSLDHCLTSICNFASQW